MWNCLIAMMAFKGPSIIRPRSICRRLFVRRKCAKRCGDSAKRRAFLRLAPLGIGINGYRI